VSKKLINRRPAIFVDVDGTLILWSNRNGRLVHKLNRALVEHLTETDNEADLILWSRRGRQYAQRMAEHHRVDHLFVAIIGKPTAIIDDEGLEWMRGVKLNPKNW